MLAAREKNRLYPTVRALNFLMYRFLIDSPEKADADRYGETPPFPSLSSRGPFSFLFLLLLPSSSRSPFFAALKTYKLIFKHGRKPNDLSRELMVKSVLLRSQTEEASLDTLVDLCSPTSTSLKTLPPRSITELALTLKSKAKTDLLQKLKSAVEARRKNGEPVTAQLKASLE